MLTELIRQKDDLHVPYRKLTKCHILLLLLPPQSHFSDMVSLLLCKQCILQMGLCFSVVLLLNL